MKPYPWSCLACGRAHAADAARCAGCGCPARASRTQVDAARRANPDAAGAPPDAPGSGAGLADLPWLPIAGVAWLLLGALTWMLGSGVTAVAFGALWVALAALCASAYRPKR